MNTDRKLFYETPPLSAAKSDVIYVDPELAGSLANINVQTEAVGLANEHGLSRVSEVHGRTLNVSINSEDMYGIYCGIHSYKGVMFNDIVSPVDRDVSSPQDALLALWPLGLAENYKKGELEQYIAVSKYLRSQGLPTDWVVRISRISAIEANGEFLDPYELLAEYAKRKADWISGLEYFSPEKVNNPEAFKNVLERYRAKMQQADLYVVERRLPVAERIADLQLATDEDELAKFLIPLNAWQQSQDMATLGYGVSELPDIGTSSGIRKYLTEWLPGAMGSYLREVHRRGLAFIYPHNQNWMTCGALADCDAVQGERLTGNRATREEYENDITLSLNALQLLAESVGVIKIAARSYGAMVRNFIEEYQKA